MMRHSLTVKFIALALAALCLLVALGSGSGILGLAAEDLYEGSVDEAYNDSMQYTRQDFAVNLVHRYASLNLGQLPEYYLHEYHGLSWMYEVFQYGSYFYTIRNEHGTVVESTMDDAPEGGTHYEMAVTDVHYRALVVENLAEEPLETTIPFPDPRANTETVRAREPEIYEDSYYNQELHTYVSFSYTLEKLPPYTVDLYLLPGAAPEEYAWTMLRQVWQIRYELFWILGASLLLFAVLAVYLCWSAGWSRDSQEPRAGGLNRIPLDVYLAGVITAGCLGYLALAEGGDYLLRTSPHILPHFLVLGGYGLCLLLVAFFFACAAQFKTPGRFWWHHSLTGLCLRLCFRLIHWGCGILGILWNWFVDALLWFLRHIPPAAQWVVDRILGFFRWLGRIIGGIFRWFGRGFGVLYGLLPLLWQWLVAGGIMLLMLVIALLNRSGEMFLFVLALCIGIVVYGAYSFGTLMQSARNMGKGDLDTKVDDRLLLGSFREFAGDLNALADVAVVAAQKQLRSERMKTELITNVSHDIKTPLTSIINYVDLLQKPHTPEEQEVYLEVLARQSGQLKKLIDDLMELSKASTGNMSVDITAVNAVEAINQALGEFSDKLEKIQLSPVFRQPEQPVYMKADGRLAWRVLSNLLNNACKYALPGTRLYIDLQEVEGKVLISMKNISREELNVSAGELLERFVRGDASRNTEGSGLGLNIAQSLMELQKGQLQLLVDGDLFKVTLIFPAVRMD